MGYEVDTSEVRKAAKEIRGIASEVKQLSSQNVKKMQSSVEENLEGETAAALTEVLNELSKDISKIGAGLDAIQNALYDYAERVEEADREAEKIING